ncbi:MAG TPA: hypothetical protein VL425_02275, partial [Rudaea sp.]|nr:hypothetical protein [Rudaea sp.]
MRSLSRCIQQRPSRWRVFRVAGLLLLMLAAAWPAIALGCSPNNPYCFDLNYVGGNGQSGAIGTTLPQPLTVSVDSAGADGQSFDVFWQVLSGSATIVESGGQTYDATSSGAVGSISIPFSVHIKLGSTPGSVLVRAYCQYCAQTGGTYVQDFNLTAVQPTLQIVSGNNQNGLLGTAATSPLVVQSSANGAPVSGLTVNWAVTGGQATLSAASSVTDANGNTSINFTYGQSAGTVTIQASAAGGAQASFTATASAPVLSALSGSSQSGTVGTALQPFVVQIGGANGATGPANVAVNWTVLQGGGTLASAQTFTDATGRTSNTLTLGANPGTNIVQASIAGAGSVTFTAVATPAVVTGSTTFAIVSGNNQALVPGQPSQPLVVKLASSSGTPISGTAIQWSVTGATAKLANATTATGADGTAQNTLTVVLPGTYTVSAQVNGVTSIPTLTFN